MAEHATRFAELVHGLTDPTFGSVPFLTWLDRRFLAAEPGWGRAAIASAARPPGLGQVAAAVAEALHRCDMVAVGPAGVGIDVAPDGEYRCRLTGVDEAPSA